MSRPGLELDDKIAASVAFKDIYDPVIFGDVAYPADITTFKRRGFKMKDWSKFPGSVKAGIEILRMLLSSGFGEPRMFFLESDPGVEFLMKQISKYSFQTDAAGEPTEDPVKEDDDEIDQLRYCVMNVVAPKGRLKGAAEATNLPQIPPDKKPAPSEFAKANPTWMSDVINRATSGNSSPSVATSADDGQGGTIIKKKSFIFDL
jgi:hypothetical protein